MNADTHAAAARITGSASNPAAATGALARMGSGFADPTHGAQQTFRTLLEAMSRPGRLQTLAAEAIAGLDASAADMAPPVGIGMAATLLTLLDADTPVLLAGAMAEERTRSWIRFHTSARAASTADLPAVAAGSARDLAPALWEALTLGSDEAPQDGATLIVEVDALGGIAGGKAGSGTGTISHTNAAASYTGARIALTLTGPGIETTQSLVVHGLPDAFWQWREALETELPRGVDLILIHGTTLAAIPRSSHIERSA